MKKIQGTGTALVTPFHKDGSIDFKAFECLLENQIENKIDFLVPLGTTGEAITLSKDEKNAVLQFVIEKVDGRVPVVVGIGGSYTTEVLSKIKSTNFEGVDAVLSVSPYYNKPSQKGIIEHYKHIAASCPVPIILYNVPGRTGSNMMAETTLELADKMENIIGIKEASGNIEQCMQIIRNKPKDFFLMSGDDALTLPLVAVGATGLISVISNVYPGITAEMTKLAIAGKFEKARNKFYQISELIPLLFVEGNPCGVKAALNAKKICGDAVRLPLISVSKTLNGKIISLVNSIVE